MTPSCAVAVARCLECPPERAGHECGEMCRTVADLLAEPGGHEAWHDAHRCRRCGGPERNPDGTSRIVDQPCSYGTCVNWCCQDCGYSDSGFGPVGCPECAPVGGRFTNWLLGYTRRFNRVRRHGTRTVDHG